MPPIGFDAGDEQLRSTESSFLPRGARSILTEGPDSCYQTRLGAAPTELTADRARALGRMHTLLRVKLVTMKLVQG